MTVIIITSALKKIALLAFFILLYGFVIFHPKDMHEVVNNSLRFCVNKLIPNVFPTMVLSSIFSDVLIANNCKKTKQSLILLTLSSWLSGFVTGPKKLSDTSNGDDITAYAFLTSNASIGFTISLVGGCLWNSISFGIYLYVIQLLTSLLIFCFIKKTPPNNIKFVKKPLISSLTISIKQSSLIMLEICGFTVVFSIINGIFSSIYSGELIKNVFAAILEISEGVNSSVLTNNVNTAIFLTGFSVGFGGLCMCLQTFSVVNNNVSHIKFIMLKLLQGAICGALCYAYSIIFSIKKNNEILTSINGELNIFSACINAILMAFTLVYIKNFLKSKTNQR